MFIRRSAAMLLVDCEMAIRSGAWTPTRSANPHRAMTALDTLLVSPTASDDDIAEATDALYDVLGQGMAAGEALVAGYEQLELDDIHHDLHAPTAHEAANDEAVAPLARAA